MESKKLSMLRQARNLAIFFLIITLLGSCCILATSFLDGPTSAKISDFIKSIFQTVKPDADIDHGNCSGVSITSPIVFGYVGEISQLTVSPVPAQSTLLPYKITIDDPNVAKLEGDKITFLSKGSAIVTVCLVDRPEISSRVRVWCIGYQAKQFVDMQCDNLFGTNNTVEARSVNTPQIYATVDGVNYHSVDWRHESQATVTDLQGNPTDIAKIFDFDFIAYKPGSVLVTFSYGPELSLKKQVQVNVVDTGVNPLPTTIVFTSQTLSVYKDEHSRPEDFVQQVLDENGNDVTDLYAGAFVLQSGNESVINVNKDKSAFSADAVGQTILTFTSIFNENLVVTVPIQVVLYEPQSLHIVGDEFLYIYDDNSYSLQNEKGQTIPSKDITWAIVKGDAQISDGVITVDGLQTVTITATVQTSNGPLTATKTLKVRFYQNFPQFIRKIAGHFSAFLILGACSMITSILCAKGKGWALPQALLYSLFIATLSEVFQLPIFTPGRTFSPIDIILNLMGSTTGCLLVLLLFGLTLAIIALCGKGKFSKVIFAIKNTHFGRFSKGKFNKFIEQISTEPLAEQPLDGNTTQ